MSKKEQDPAVEPAPAPEPAPTSDTQNWLSEALGRAGEQYAKIRRAAADQVDNVRRQLNEGWDAHLESLVELFELKIQEYVRRRKRYVAAMVVGAGLLGCAYLALCIYAVLLLQPVLTLSWAVLSVALFNALVGFIALLVAWNSKL